MSSFIRVFHSCAVETKEITGTEGEVEMEGMQNSNRSLNASTVTIKRSSDGLKEGMITTSFWHLVTSKAQVVIMPSPFFFFFSFFSISNVSLVIRNKEILRSEGG